MTVTETFFVGEEYSMTHLACCEKFIGRKLTSKKFLELKSAIENGLPTNKSGVLPLWSSNAGIIPQTEPERLIFEAPAAISELWCKKIVFAYATRPDFKGAPTKIGSVGVARKQCSKFLEKENLADSFLSYETTTDAVVELFSGKIDGVLCSNELAVVRGLKVLKEDCANPFNATTFLEFVKRNQLEGDVHLAAIEMPRLDMGRTTQAHERIMEEIFGDVRDFADMPKIMFAVQTPNREDKYWLLIEFPNFPGDQSPLPPFGERADVRVVGHAGKLQESFSPHACDYMAKTFCDSAWPEFAHYGEPGGYFCACPTLDIFVQGYNLAIVKELALLSLEKHVDLFAHDVKHPHPAARKTLKKLLERRKKGERIQDFVNFVLL
jgi:prephenate dehydratase